MTKWRSSDSFVAITISVAIFTDMFLYAVVVPVLPFALSERAGIAEKDLQFWSTFLLSAYTSTFLVGSIVFGWATDQISKRSSLLFMGLFLMLGATFMLAFTRTIVPFVISRMLQGLAGAIVWSAGLALLFDTFGHARFGKMLAYVIICQTSALTVAPVVGGFIYAQFGYHAVIAVCFTLVAIDILLRLLLVENSTRSSRNVTSSKQNSDTSSLFITPVLDDLFPATDRTPLVKKPSKSMHSSWYAFIIIATCPRVLASLLCFASIWALQTSFDAVLPYKVRDLFHWSSTGSGLIFLPIVFPAFLSPFGHNLYMRWGARKVAAGLFLGGIPAFACLSIVQHNDTIDRVLLCCFLFLAGLVINLSIAPLTSDMTYMIQELEIEHPDSFGDGGYGRAFGLLNCAFAIGGVVGPPLSVLLATRLGWIALCLAMSGLCVVDAILVMLFVGGLPFHMDGEDECEERDEHDVQEVDEE